MADNNKNKAEVVLAVTTDVETKLGTIQDQIERIKQAANKSGSTFFNSAAANLEIANHNKATIMGAQDEVIAVKKQVIANTNTNTNTSPQADIDHSGNALPKPF